MKFTILLVVMSVATFLWTLFQLANTSQVILTMHEGAIQKFIGRRLTISVGLLVWAAYRAWG